jgi:methionyl aminopeptidase
MIVIKSPEEISLMQEGGQKLGRILQELLLSAKPGTPLLEIEKLAQSRIRETGGEPSFMTVEGYKWATCLCVNEGVVHCIPTGRILETGDILTVDIGLLYRGFHTDTASTIVIGGEKKAGSRIRDFLNTGEDTLYHALNKARPGNHIGDISREIQSGIEDKGYHVVRTLVGHGVGRILHEEPQIPGYIKMDIEDTPVIRKGMTLAIEVIYGQGTGTVVYDNNDGWTIATKDRSVSAVFEHSIAVTADEPLILTKI